MTRLIKLFCFTTVEVYSQLQCLTRGGSPVRVVKGRDSLSRVCGFESQHRIQDRHFSQQFEVKIYQNYNVCFIRPKQMK